MGRRAWHRVPCGHDVRLRGAGGTEYTGETVDLSRGGALVAVTDPVFLGEDRDGVELVAERFPDGLEIVFGANGATRRARIVRATLQRGSHLALGCAFDSLLTARDALELGIVAGESGVEEASAATLPFLVRPGVAMSLVLEGVAGTLVGPLAVGPVSALGERTVEAALARDVDAVVASCANVPFGIHLVVGRDQVWSGRGTLVACADEGRGCRVRVVAGSEFTRAVLKRLRTAPATRS
jgi:hypothetical protein